MNRLKLLLCVIFLGMFMCSGCSHTKVSNVGLLSFGDLEGKTIPQNFNGPILEGRTQIPLGKRGAHSYYLSDAVSDALKNTQYDTLVDAEIIDTYSSFIRPLNLLFFNGIIIKGKALDSKTLKAGGE